MNTTTTQADAVQQEATAPDVCTDEVLHLLNLRCGHREVEHNLSVSMAKVMAVEFYCVLARLMPESQLRPTLLAMLADRVSEMVGEFANELTAFEGNQ